MCLKTAVYAKWYPLGQTFVDKKNNKRWLWIAVNHWQLGMQPPSEASRV